MRPSLYEYAGGDAAFLRLAQAHHDRCLADPELNHPFSHEWLNPEHVGRLAAYWGEVMGAQAPCPRFPTITAIGGITAAMPLITRAAGTDQTYDVPGKHDEHDAGAHQHEVEGLAAHASRLSR